MDHMKNHMDNLSRNWRMMGRPTLICPVNAVMLGVAHVHACVCEQYQHKRVQNVHRQYKYTKRIESIIMKLKPLFVSCLVLGLIHC